jgi:hypothetical protein
VIAKVVSLAIHAGNAPVGWRDLILGASADEKISYAKLPSFRGYLRFIACLT